jgi:two-component system, NarL family, nitrate/nitrite response regulator NarL
MQLHPSLDPLDDVGLAVSLRALVVGEDPLVRESFVRRLEHVATAEAVASDDLREAALRQGANVIVWDLGPGTPDLHDALLGELGVPVIALSSPEGNAIELLAAGASAVLRRDTPPDALRSAMATVQFGLRVVEPSLLEIEAPRREEPREITAGVDALTPRERDVLDLMATGLSNKQIASRLGISSHTAKFHIGAILAKLGAATRTEAVVRAVQRGLVLL